jgi:hypothetical protein
MVRSEISCYDRCSAISEGNVDSDVFLIRVVQVASLQKNLAQVSAINRFIFRLWIFQRVNIQNSHWVPVLSDRLKFLTVRSSANRIKSFLTNIYHIFCLFTILKGSFFFQTILPEQHKLFNTSNALIIVQSLKSFLQFDIFFFLSNFNRVNFPRPIFLILQGFKVLT